MSHPVSKEKHTMPRHFFNQNGSFRRPLEWAPSSSHLLSAKHADKPQTQNSHPPSYSSPKSRHAIPPHTPMLPPLQKKKSAKVFLPRIGLSIGAASPTRANFECSPIRKKTPKNVLHFKGIAPTAVHFGFTDHLPKDIFGEPQPSGLPPLHRTNKGHLSFMKKETGHQRI